MDIKVVWSPGAVEDLDSIAKYIARDSEFYARSVVLEILAVTRSMREFPHIGRVVPELGATDVRERIVHAYRLVYRLESRRILIVAVIHGKRSSGFITDRM